MDCHLVSVEVGVERRTDKRMDLNSFSFDEDRLERLDSKPMQGWSSVEKNRVLPDYFLKNIPNHVLSTLNQSLCSLDILSVAQINQSLHYKWLEQFERHDFREPTLM